MEIEKNRLKRLLCDIGKRMYDKGYVSGYAGNLSARLPGGRVVITPSGLCKGRLEPEMILEVGRSGNVISRREGFEPSSEMDLHLKTYSVRKDVNGIVHAHPKHVTALSLTHIDPTAPVLPETLLALGDIGMSDPAVPGSKALVNSVARLAGTRDAIILKGHGSLTLGEDIEEAYFRLETLEHACEIIYKTACLAKPIRLSHDVVRELEKLRRE